MRAPTKFSIEMGALIRNPESDYRPALDALNSEWRAERLTLSDMGPALALLHFVILEHHQPWIMRAAMHCYLWVLRIIVYRHRPLWNDFHMALWLLTREEPFAEDLYRHLKTAVSRRRELQATTGEWMIRSVREQEPDFCQQWTKLVYEHGPVFPSDYGLTLSEARG